MGHRPAAVVAAALSLLLAVAAPAGAATLTPTRVDDPAEGGADCSEPPLDCSLRNALDAAQPGGVVDLRTGPAGPYLVTQDRPLEITGSVALVGPGAASRAIARTAGVGSVFSIAAPRGDNGPPSAPPPADVFIGGLTITGGRGQRFGGGLTIWSARNVVLRGLAITGNRSDPAAGGEGGGVGGGVMAFGSSVTIVDSSITGNVAASGEFLAPGGGVYNGGGPVRIVNSTISGNQAERGGGLYQAVGGGGMDRTLLTNVTLAGNSAPGGGGNLFIFSGDLISTGSIVAAGSGPRGSENCGGDVPSANLISRRHNVESPTTQCNFTSPGDLQGVSDPGLAALDASGTLALLTGSPAIDAGPEGGCAEEALGPLATDQRGEPRPQGRRCDAGAFEAPAERDATYPGCRVIGTPRAAGEEVRGVVGCGSTRRVVVTGSLTVDPPARAAGRIARTTAARALGRATRIVRRGRRATLALRLRADDRRRLRQARLEGRQVRVSLTVRARRVRNGGLR